MKTTEKIIIAGIVGTTFMTLYSYIRAKKERQQYVEPVLINKLIDNSENVDLDDTASHPAGWGLHYATGIAFIAAYYFVWKKALQRPNTARMLWVGIISGAVGIAVWKLLFTHHDKPPQNYRYGYYRQLLIAHIVFSLSGIATFRALGNSEHN
jgi:hypothetical protein